MCLPMLADTSRWLLQMAKSPSVVPEVALALVMCHETLRYDVVAAILLPSWLNEPWLTAVQTNPGQIWKHLYPNSWRRLRPTPPRPLEVG